MTSNRDIAIQFALDNKWKEACNTNENLIKANPKDLDSLNRLAFACLKLGKYRKSKSTYLKVLEIDKTNPIANKNIRKLAAMSKKNKDDQNGEAPQNHNIGNLFIQEAGKTKTIDLKNIADKKTLLTLENGDEVILAIKRSKIFVQSRVKTYIGMLPDDVGSRLISFMKSGNEYQACIKSVDEKKVAVFIKETKQAKKLANQHSFA